MKRIFLPLFFLTFSLILAGIFIYQIEAVENDSLFKISEIIHVSVILVLFILGLWASFKRHRDNKLGYTEDDELSKRVVEKSSAVSFYLSIIIWLVLAYIYHLVEIDGILIFGYGLIGMTLTFIFSWLHYNYHGIKND